MAPRLGKKDAIELEIDPFGIVPGRKLEGVDEKGNKIGLTEKEWYAQLVKHAKELCKGKSGLEAASAILKDIETEVGRPEDGFNYYSGGALGIKYQGSEEHPEGTNYRGIDAFAKKRGDCNEVSYLFCMMARAIGLKAYVTQVHLTSVEEREYGEGHVIVAFFLTDQELSTGKGFEYQQLSKWTDYPPDSREKVLEKFGFGRYDNFHIVLMDPVSHRIEHFHPVTIKRDEEARALHYSELGALLTGQKQYAKALRLLERAKELDPSLEATYANLGALFAEQMDAEKNPKKKQQLFERAELNFKKALELHSTSFVNMHNLSLIYYKIGEFEKSEKMVKKILDEIGGTADGRYVMTAHFRLCLIRAEQGKYRESDDEFETVMKMNLAPSGKIELLYSLGEIYYKRGVFDKAFRFFRDVTYEDSYSQQKSNATFMLGKCQLKQGDKISALATFEKYLGEERKFYTLNPDMVKEARELIKQLKSENKTAVH